MPKWSTTVPSCLDLACHIHSILIIDDVIPEKFGDTDHTR